MLRIIYPQPGGPIAIITPVQVEAQEGETAERGTRGAASPHSPHNA